ncbi:glycosyltransferase [Candidatus Babeliales bacterium]|nr:glycosyltransferase [Candidatus Babeliales bacterium]
MKNRIILFAGVLLSASVLQASQKPLKIVMSQEHFPVSTNTFVINQFVGLLERGHEVYMHAQPWQGRTLDIVLRYGLLDKIFPSFSSEIANADIVLAQFGPRGVQMLELKKKDNLPGKLVTCFRGHDISAYEKRNPGVYRELLQEGDLFLPVCEYFAKRLVELGADPKKVVVHHSAIDCKKFAFKKHELPVAGPIKIVSTSRLACKKGIDYAIKAVVQLHELYPNIHYTIIGGGGQRDRLENMVNALGAKSYIFFTGWLEPEHVIKILNQSDIFILPSMTALSGDQEGIPNALKEAMALGLPVVSTYHSGIPELVTHGVSGLLAPEKDHATLAQNLKFLIENPDVWEPMTRAARTVIEQEFNLETESERLEQILCALVQEGER